MLGSSPFDPASTDSEFRLAMSDIGEIMFLSRILEYWSTPAPRATVRAASLPPSALAHRLEDGSVDLAVGYFPEVKGNRNIPAIGPGRVGLGIGLRC